ncbi:hypothetical protein HYC85_028807 [Camellia sinensis]|uniref:Uncharacterized protein n=1 Tax=Camellia sinensis TaxID=4442 RepID=A0A7J7G062_CAMSI|nr:hypothetical protein HYC85_028807 [Camellia sinensis]
MPSIHTHAECLKIPQRKVHKHWVCKIAQLQSISDRKTLVDPFDDDDDNSSIQVVDDLSISNIKTLFNPFDDPFDDDDDNSSIQVVDDLSISDIKTLVNPFDDDDDNSSIQVVDDLSIIDFYFSAVISNENEDQMFPISDSKYAEELQFQEALMSSVIASKSSVPPLMMIEEKAKAEEVGELSHCFCEICVERKEVDEKKLF